MSRTERKTRDFDQYISKGGVGPGVVRVWQMGIQKYYAVAMLLPFLNAMGFIGKRGRRQRKTRIRAEQNNKN